MRTQRKVVNSLALTVALGASATNLQVKADEVITPVAESTETVVTATPTTVSAEQVEQAKEVASADAQAVEAQTTVDAVASQTLATETQTVEKLTEAVAQASTAQEALPAAEAEVATQTEAVEQAKTAVDTAQEVVDSANPEVASAQASAEAANAVEAQASATLEEAKAQPVVTAETVDAQIAETKSTISEKEAEVAKTVVEITATDGKIATAQEAVDNYKPTTVTKTVASSNYVEASGADRDMEDIIRETFPDVNPADYARQIETVIFDGEDTKTVVLTAEQAKELAETGSFTYTFDAKAVSEEVVNIINELRRINGITLTPRYGMTQDDIALKVTDNLVDIANARANELVTNFSHIEGNKVNMNENGFTKYSESLLRQSIRKTTSAAHSNEELAYNIVLDWFSEYNNTQVSFGHRLHLLNGATTELAVGMASGNGMSYFALLTGGQANALRFEQSTVDGKLTQTYNGERLKFLPKRTFNYVTTTVVDNSQALKDAVVALEAEKSALLAQQSLASDALNQAVSALATLEQAKTDITLANAKRTAAIAEAQMEFDSASAEAKTANTTLRQALASQEEALANLEKAKGELTDAQGKLATAKAKVAELKLLLATQNQLLADLEAAKERLSDAEVAKGESSALLAELVAKATASQAEADRLTTLFALQEEFNTVITEDEVTATPKDAPTAPALPAVDFNDLFTKPSEEPQTTDVEVPKDGDKGQDLNVIDNIDNEKTVVTPTVYKPQAGITVQQTATGEKVTYSRVERAHTLPNTGSDDNIVLMGIGVVLAGLGLEGARRRRHG
ncbi:LPXTG cell wall anchor domain-containing protein [Streptococcus suis]|uniref:LPXTG cell wall surface protein n=4 Tax=Streptococcus suis TaxID=1307 RepID=A0A0Z8KIA9_STRSU|nr:CAP domain-containing protein [Streptococcus suis]MDX4991284.1 LPXTG cell wall anchor domain-containing protein [Streptococcus suis]NQG42350.1 LPXTG cell wall anchor domain-containing protein [Streptococcus suis]NQG72857.1 LPXTG cell wall anchor domain-containing protein [Streptococcus suis]NQQ49917.1 LPXTG cell wall anchor domain-containing protein [Streptococcus suis]CYV45160.1 LPXTG cell wall surface protein [Streptococcus suis]